MEATLKLEPGDGFRARSMGVDLTREDDRHTNVSKGRAIIRDIASRQGMVDVRELVAANQTIRRQNADILRLDNCLTTIAAYWKARYSRAVVLGAYFAFCAFLAGNIFGRFVLPRIAEALGL